LAIDCKDKNLPAAGCVRNQLDFIHRFVGEMLSGCVLQLRDGEAEMRINGSSQSELAQRGAPHRTPGNCLNLSDISIMKLR